MTTGPAQTRHEELPRTTTTRAPRDGLLRRGQGFARRVVRLRYPVDVRGAENFPEVGAVVVVANHVSFIDGPLMAIMSPRPVHVLTKVEMFHGPLKVFLHATGQVSVRRFETDPAAVRTVLRVLRDQGAVGVFPESTRGAGEMTGAVAGGAAYFAMATGATVVPLAMLGTREPGSSLHSVPPAGSRVAMTFGEPMSFARQPWPRRRADVDEASERVRQAVLRTLREAESGTGLQLPGPELPAEEPSNSTQKESR